MRFINRDFVNQVLGRLGFQVIRNYELSDISSIFEITCEPELYQSAHRAEGIVFSMDRAIQLHALLSSYFEKVKNPAPIHLFYRTSSGSHQKAYEELIALFSDRLSSVTIQDPFRGKMIAILERVEAPKVFFLCDDDLFIEDVDMDDFTRFSPLHFIPSLRLGLHLRRSYTADAIQPLPRGYHKIDDGQKICWQWKDGSYEWGFPLSLDGNLFSTREMLAMVKRIQFSAPNSLEGSLHRFRDIYKHRYGICYTKAKIVNIPCNSVQIEIDNKHGSEHQDFLLEKWNQGLQINYRKIYGFVNESAHQEIPFEYIRREM